MVNTKRQIVAKVEKVESLSEQYVYDISVANQDPYFFANGHLVHNTDSSYFSAWSVIKDKVESGELEWGTDQAIALYDGLADDINVSFPGYMYKAYNCPAVFGELIKCGREVVATKGLFITKKRYALMVVDNEGERQDVDGKPGKIKAMGLDLKRSDTQVVIQEFLKDILEATLTDQGKDAVIEKILDFKTKFSERDSWEKGSPKRVNNLTKYSALENYAKAKGDKARLPGHVRAAYNFNNLRKMHGDNYTMAIEDGMKCIVCRLKDNPQNITSVARPTDENNIPQWFRDLPFDDATMEEVLDKKVDNLLGELKWDLSTHTDTSSTFSELFEF